MSIFFACPYYAARHFYLSATQLTDFLTPAEWFLLAIKVLPCFILDFYEK